MTAKHTGDNKVAVSHLLYVPCIETNKSIKKYANNGRIKNLENELIIKITKVRTAKAIGSSSPYRGAKK